LRNDWRAWGSKIKRRCAMKPLQFYCISLVARRNDSGLRSSLTMDGISLVSYGWDFHSRIAFSEPDYNCSTDE
jgi:hypothetical protein